MRNLNRHLPQVDPSHFAMVPRSDVPRSNIKTRHTNKDTFDCDFLVPILVDEVLPGDVHDGELTVFARINNLIFPLMDNLTLETFFFFVPNRLLWDNWQKFMGEQKNPGDSISFTIPQMVSPAGGWSVGSLADHFGLPTLGQFAGAGTISINSLPFRAYNLIWNEWFRDEDLQNSVVVDTDDGPDNTIDYQLLRRNKRHDYFTSARPWPLKGGTEILLPINGAATVKTASASIITGTANPLILRQTTGAIATGGKYLATTATNGTPIASTTNNPGDSGSPLYPANLYADLSTATGATINALRLSAATQQFLEKDARGGTRYTELLRNHFGVTPEDARLQRPEYIGGGISKIQTQAIPQTSATGINGGTSPAGSLSGQAIATGQHRYKYHATEHGYLIGLANITGDVTYQQGTHRLWYRSTRFDFYWPTFAHLGEQAIPFRELWTRGDGGDVATFGYQERWAEYRYKQSQIKGLFKSTAAGNIDEWHLAQQFATQPVLNSTFIQQTTPASRVLAAGTQADGFQILWDSVFSISLTRPIPVYSVPGLTRF